MPLTSVHSDAVSSRSSSIGAVLVVEDPLVSKLVRSVLQRHGYEVKLATAAEAMAILEAPDSEPGILLTNAPAAFLEFSDRVPLLYLSSSPDALMQATFTSCRVVVKPFVPEDLARAVSELAAL